MSTAIKISSENNGAGKILFSVTCFFIPLSIRFFFFVENWTYPEHAKMKISEDIIRKDRLHFYLINQSRNKWVRGLHGTKKWNIYYNSWRLVSLNHTSLFQFLQEEGANCNVGLHTGAAMHGQVLTPACSIKPWQKN